MAAAVRLRRETSQGIAESRSEYRKASIAVFWPASPGDAATAQCRSRPADRSSGSCIRPRHSSRSQPGSLRAGQGPTHSSHAAAVSACGPPAPLSAVVIMPPSPVVRIFRGWKLKHAIDEYGDPIRLPSYSEPIAHAASSMTISPWREAISLDFLQGARAIQSGGPPGLPSSAE